MTNQPNDYDDIARRLALAMREEADLAMTTTNTPQQMQRFQDDVRRRRRRNQVLAIAAATIVVVIGATYAALAFSGSSHQSKSRLPGTHQSPQPVVTQTLPAPTPLSQATAVAVVNGPVQLGPAAFGAIWATGPGRTSNSGVLYRVSLDGRSILSTTSYTGWQVDRPPVQVGSDMAVPAVTGSRSEWLIVNASGHQITTVPVTVTGLGAGDSTGGWLQTDVDTVGRFDIGSTKLGRHVTITGSQLSALAVGGGYLWAGDENNLALLQVDETTGATVHSYPVPSRKDIVLQVVYADGAVYMSSQDFGLRRIDVATHRVTAITHAPSNGYWFLVGVAPGGELWGESAPGVVDEFDPATLAAKRVLQVFLTVKTRPSFGSRNQLDALGFGVTVTANRVFLSDGPGHEIHSFPLG